MKLKFTGFDLDSPEIQYCRKRKIEMMDGDLKTNGFCLIRRALNEKSTSRIASLLDGAFATDASEAGTKSSRGHVYAARNLIETVPEILQAWCSEPLLNFLANELGPDFGLVRILFFDKPPDRTWTLPWHKDQSVAVKDNSIESEHFCRPTLKSGVPHFIASDSVLKQMLTLRIHLDQVTEENGPLEVIPESHDSSTSQGKGVESSVAIMADAGDVLAMRPLISHSSGSSLQGTNRHRRILHLEFAANQDLPDGVEWHDFVQPK